MSTERRMHPGPWIPVLHVRIHNVHHSASDSTIDFGREVRFSNRSEAHLTRVGRWNGVFRFLTCLRISEEKSADNLCRGVLHVSPDLPVEPIIVE